MCVVEMGACAEKVAVAVRGVTVQVFAVPAVAVRAVAGWFVAVWAVAVWFVEVWLRQCGPAIRAEPAEGDTVFTPSGAPPLPVIGAQAL